MSQKTLIFGGGAIGSYLAACLNKAGHKIYFLCRGQHYKKIKSTKLKVHVYNNKTLKQEIFLQNSNDFQVINNLKKINYVKFDNIFITTKINNNLKKTFKLIEKFINKKTIIITPCTEIPFWWYECLNRKKKRNFEKKLFYLFLKNIRRKNLVGMTMWLSGKIISPGFIKINHIQRGFPIKEVYGSRKKQVDILRKDLRKTTISPNVKNIFSEILIKSINSLAFNLIAIKYNQNNKFLNKNLIAKKEILNILKEGDGILKLNRIRVFQSPKSRIKQTLKSTTHTMSMLNALKNKKKIELRYLWLSVENLINNINYKMLHTRKIYKQVLKKINGHI